MYYSDISFEKKLNSFSHNLKADFACFALWKQARPYRDKIRNLLSSRFQILLETEIEWSEQHFHSNTARLYEEPLTVNKDNREITSGYAEKIGDTKFILFIIKDDTPDYTYAMSVSRKIELSNMNVVKAKYQIRDWIREDLNIKYAVHSTNNIYEFFFQTSLLLGIDLFKDLLAGERHNIDKIKKDLEGANGWRNWKEVFDILNLTTNYLVLRGFETLPENNPEMDIDVLTDNYQLFASSLGAKQLPKQPYKGFIMVSNEKINVDIRFVGDKYYDVSWSKDMLHAKVRRNGLFIPREDHYFFSLLFHAKAQKPVVKDKYIKILENIAKNQSFNWYQTELLYDDKVIGEMLNGYFRTNQYFYESSIDTGVYKNINVLKHLRCPKDFLIKASFTNRVKRKIRNIILGRMISPLKKVKK